MTGYLPQAAGAFTLGAFALELGSLANTLCEVHPEEGRQAFRRWMTPAMAASNGFSICLVLWLAWTFDGYGAAAWWVAATVGTALSVLRQQEWNKLLKAKES
eukprot:CAMPEP_0174740078 /NCGR_PEP_ID=MMETSP1094-20130205/72663_1 /TAXON_ID=156173 /ORGANISM="Chrysochromulina brevifilum, Strain UTEX LB 985" /LENGTH=101 /DNA_ID=CAMNT_0015943715 /DNA_START=48 /DNA_END=353 /DNA_ORIENTATION=-